MVHFEGNPGAGSLQGGSQVEVDHLCQGQGSLGLLQIAEGRAARHRQHQEPVQQEKRAARQRHDQRDEIRQGRKSSL